MFDHLVAEPLADPEPELNHVPRRRSYPEAKMPDSLKTAADRDYGTYCLSGEGQSLAATPLCLWDALGISLLSTSYGC